MATKSIYKSPAGEKSQLWSFFTSPAGRSSPCRYNHSIPRWVTSSAASEGTSISLCTAHQCPQQGLPPLPPPSSWPRMLRASQCTLRPHACAHSREQVVARGVNSPLLCLETQLHSEHVGHGAAWQAALSPPPTFAPPDSRAWSETDCLPKHLLALPSGRKCFLEALCSFALTVPKLLTVESHIPPWLRGVGCWFVQGERELSPCLG